MGNHSDGSPNHSGTVATAGQNDVEKFQDPGLPPHRLRLADTDPRAAKKAERQVALLFGISVVGTLIFLVAYFAIDLGNDSSIATIRLQNMPVFNDANITPEGKRDVITFLKQIESTGSPGGNDLGALGPVSEGLFVWIAGLGVIIAFTIWLTSRTS